MTAHPFRDPRVMERPGVKPNQASSAFRTRGRPHPNRARVTSIPCALPPPYYEVHVLAEFEHLSNDDIAGRLSVPLSIAKMRLHPARAMVTTELRKNCRCYYNERGELMGEPKPK